MIGPDWQIGRILGIPIKVHLSWFVIFAFVTWSLATGYLPDMLPGLTAPRYWAMAGVAALLLFASVLLHELGHSYVALRYRIPIRQITLFVFGGVAQMHREPPGPRAEFLIAIAGPAVSFFLGGAMLGLAALTQAGQGLVALGLLLGSVNLQLGLFNLIPGFPLDGGRVVRAGLWAWSGNFHRATSQASLAGQVCGLAIGLLGAGLILGATFGLAPRALAANGGWIMLIGLFLFGAARGSRRQAGLQASLGQVPVADLMTREVVTLPPGMTVEEAVTRHFLPRGYGAFPVVEDGRPVGMLSVQEVRALPPQQWPWRSVGQALRPWLPSMEIGLDATALNAYEQMQREGHERLAVMQEGRLVGLVTRAAISRWLQLRGLGQ